MLPWRDAMRPQHHGRCARRAAIPLTSIGFLEGGARRPLGSLSPSRPFVLSLVMSAAMVAAMVAVMSAALSAAMSFLFWKRDARNLHLHEISLIFHRQRHHVMRRINSANNSAGDTQPPSQPMSQPPSQPPL